MFYRSVMCDLSPRRLPRATLISNITSNASSTYRRAFHFAFSGWRICASIFGSEDYALIHAFLESPLSTLGNTNSVLNTTNCFVLFFFCLFKISSLSLFFHCIDAYLTVGLFKYSSSSDFLNTIFLLYMFSLFYPSIMILMFLEKTCTTKISTIKLFRINLLCILLLFYQPYLVQKIKLFYRSQ